MVLRIAHCVLVVHATSFLWVVATTALETPPLPEQQRPIVGILTLPSVEGLPTNASYLPASYVKWLESSGLRVAPLRYDAPPDILRGLARQMDGILFTGGSSELFVNGTPSAYYRAGKLLYEEVVLAGSAGAGEPISLWGTCLGLEMLAILISSNISILSSFDAENISLPLHFTQEAPDSTLFGPMSPGVASAFATPVTVNEHSLGVAPSALEPHRDLIAVLAVNTDRQGKTFVSAFEHRTLPIFAVQFHPERPAFEWITQRYIPHTPQAVVAMQYLADTFAAQVRKSWRHFRSVPEERAALIYDWAPFFSEEVTAYYEQMYAFPLL